MEFVLEGNLWYRGRLVKGCLGIEDGRIAAVKKVLRGSRHMDVGDRLVLPAAVDAHVHLRDPGMTHKEDFFTGTRAAALGGVCTVLDMPNTVPFVDTMEKLEEKDAAVRRKACVDYGLFLGLTDRVPEGLDMACGVKVYYESSTGSGAVRDMDLIRECAERTAVVVHAEDRRQGTARNLEEYSALSTGEAEVVRRLRDAGRIHVAHITTPEVLQVEGCTFEAAPHHLLLHHGMDLGSRGKVNPPLRSRETRDSLWKAFARGKIHVLASDHAPHTAEEKDVKFQDAPAGIPGTEFMLPLMMARVRHQQLGLEVLVAASAERPAEIFSISAGKLEPGAAAHIAVYSMRRLVKVKKTVSRCSWTPYTGMEMVPPEYVFLNGEMIVDSWEFTGEPGMGRNIMEG